MGKNTSLWWGWLPMPSLAPGWQWGRSNWSAAPCNVCARACPTPCREDKGVCSLAFCVLNTLSQEGQPTVLTQTVCA